MIADFKAMILLLIYLFKLNRKILEYYYHYNYQILIIITIKINISNYYNGYVIHLILNDGRETLPFTLTQSMQRKWIIYVSYVKY